MPTFEENYSQNKIDLIKESETLQTWSGATDYVRLTVYDSDTEAFVGRYYSNQLIDGNPQIEVYTDFDGTDG